MASRLRCWWACVALATLVPACGGRATSSASAADGGSRAVGGSGAVGASSAVGGDEPGNAQGGNGASSGVGAAPSAGGAAPGAGAGGSAAGRPGDCVGTFDEVATAWGTGCPATICEAMVEATACGSLPANIVASTNADCDCASCEGGDSLRAVTLSVSATQGTACYYSIADGQGALVGAAAWDGTASYCNGTSKQIRAGVSATSCTASPSALCDRTTSTSGAGGASGDDRPPPACLNGFDHDCEPCCPATPPDCTGKPNGYPGYTCTPQPGSFDACACYAGQWMCAS